MSRIGNKKIETPSGLTVTITGAKVEMSSQKGAMSHRLPEGISVRKDGTALIVERQSDIRRHKALHGLTRTLLDNMTIGLTQGFSKQLEVIGVGYKTRMDGQKLVITTGYSHDLIFELPKGIAADVDKNNVITISGADKQVVGDLAARIRKSCPPEPYKGKGIKYVGERIRRKAGKALGK